MAVICLSGWLSIVLVSDLNKLLEILLDVKYMLGYPPYLAMANISIDMVHFLNVPYFLLHFQCDTLKNTKDWCAPQPVYI